MIMNGILCNIASLYEKDGLQVFSTYFKNGTWPWIGNGYLEAVIIAVGMALIGLLVFYVGIGNLSFKWSKVSTWVIVGLAACGLTFAAYDINTGMTPGCGYGLQKTLDEQFKKFTQGLDRETAQYKEYEAAKRSYKTHFKAGVFSVKPVLVLCILSSLLTMVLYAAVSFIRPVRRLFKNKYAQNIPIK